MRDRCFLAVVGFLTHILAYSQHPICENKETNRSRAPILLFMTVLALDAFLTVSLLPGLACLLLPLGWPLAGATSRGALGRRHGGRKQEGFNGSRLCDVRYFGIGLKAVPIKAWTMPL